MSRAGIAALGSQVAAPLSFVWGSLGRAGHISGPGWPESTRNLLRRGRGWAGSAVVLESVASRESGGGSTSGVPGIGRSYGLKRAAYPRQSIHAPNCGPAVVPRCPGPVGYQVPIAPRGSRWARAAEIAEPRPGRLFLAPLDPDVAAEAWRRARSVGHRIPDTGRPAGRIRSEPPERLSRDLHLRPRRPRARHLPGRCMGRGPCGRRCRVSPCRQCARLCRRRA